MAPKKDKEKEKDKDATGESQTADGGDGIENFELPKSLVAKIAKSEVCW
jgi:hypothetical protein